MNAQSNGKVKTPQTKIIVGARLAPFVQTCLTGTYSEAFETYDKLPLADKFLSRRIKIESKQGAVKHTVRLHPFQLIEMKFTEMDSRNDSHARIDTVIQDKKTSVRSDIGGVNAIVRVNGNTRIETKTIWDRVRDIGMKLALSQRENAQTYQYL